jgi:hypothetical protein
MRDFDGETIVPERDAPRLTKQYDRVWEATKGGAWQTLDQIKGLCSPSDTVPAISARLRDFRKEKNGAHTVNRRYLHDGLFEYQLVVKGK